MTSTNRPEETGLPSSRTELEAPACDPAASQPGIQSSDRSVSDVLAEAEELRASNAALLSRNKELVAALKLAREASETKSRFLASASHELRTPLNGVIGFSQLLHDEKLGPLNPDQKDCLGDVLNCSHHLLGLIGQILDLAKIEAGKTEVRRERIRLKDFVQATIDSIGALAALKNIEVRLCVAPTLDWIQADPVHLRQVIFNYLSNALKFTPDGGLVSVSLDLADGHWSLSVTDTGGGISAEDLPRLFTEFGQLGPGDKAKTGTGLGLAITRRIVEAQGGRVGVESVLGKGSRFWAVFPSFR